MRPTHGATSPTRSLRPPATPRLRRRRMHRLTTLPPRRRGGAEGWSEDSTTATDEPQADADAAGEVPFVMEEDTGPAEAEHSATQRQRWLSQPAADAGEQSDVAPGEDAEAEAVYGEGAQEGASYAEEAPAGDGYAEGDASGQEYVDEGAASDQGHA